MADLPNESNIVASAQAGDVRAFSQLFRAYSRPLYTYVLIPMLGDTALAEDCLRETFLAAHRALPSYEWRPPGIFPWLKTLARNKARDALRKSQRTKRLHDNFQIHLETLGHQTDAVSVREEEERHGELRGRVQAILDELNPRYAAALRLRVLEEHSREDCAKYLEVKVATFDVLFYRACQSFRQALERKGSGKV